ncbi:MAG: ParA family protein [Pseudomonadales bacterium]|nr:ParA family protein [Pseudomonadales bacterium]
MKIWTVANQKGGVGKTTTTVSVADALAGLGYRVLLMDLDPQASLTCYMQLDPDQVENTSYDLFNKPERIRPVDTGFEGLHIVGASMALANVEKRSSSIDGKGLVLKRWLQQHAQAYDYVLIDTPPALGMMMINALAACDHLLVPVQTDFLALKGLERMMKVLGMLAVSGAEIPHTVIATMFDKRTNASRRTYQFLKNQYKTRIWPGVIPVDTKFREASRLGVPPSFLFAQSHGIVAYQKLTRDLLPDDLLRASESPVASPHLARPVDKSSEALERPDQAENA